MTLKSPRLIRRDLEEARDRTRLLIDALRKNQGEQRWGLGEECAKAALRLEEILQETQVPAEYKVAIIGRFKAGKTSFVNQLIGRRLAGENTDPETAAITTFRFGANVVGKVKFVDFDTWTEIKARYDLDATDPEVHRVTNWLKFGVKDLRSHNSAQGDPFDLDAIEQAHIKKGGHTLTIPMATAIDAEADRKAENQFRSRIREYSSGAKPYHCLVESIEIESPSSILDEGVVLVDTPGLDDTERFRVQLTKQAVQDVDAVLFLTKSGGSYGQAEKDFLLSLLRTGKVKQLVFVVTQVDQTYEQHVRDSREQDENPEAMSVRLSVEGRRIRAAIERTFDELSKDSDSSSVAKYRELLDSIEISFTSAANHRDHARKELVRYPIQANDPGGMHEVQETLFRTLSTESRLAAAKHAFHRGISAVLEDLRSVIDRRRAVVSGLKDREVAEQKLAAFRHEFEMHGGAFSGATKSDLVILKTTLENRKGTEEAISQLIAYQADEVLRNYEVEDAARHWRTKRGGNWGFMRELQTRVANRIFPKVAEQLAKQTEEFANFVDKFRAHISLLSSDAKAATDRLEIGEKLQLDVGENLESFLKGTLGSIQELIEAEETKIVALLEEFIDEHVEAKIATARERVAGIWGRGTTAGQSIEVQNFYRDVRFILRAALQAHVRQRFIGFAYHLTAEADALPEKTLSQVRAQINRAATDIRAAAEAAIAGQKGAFERFAAVLLNELSTAQPELENLLAETGAAVGWDAQAEAPAPELLIPATAADAVMAPHITAGNSLETQIDDQDVDPVASIRRRATRLLTRHTLRAGEKGWPLTRIFANKYLSCASEAWLIDPYLALRHQRRNLTEFVSVLKECAQLKTLHILTRELDSMGGAREALFYDQLDRQSYETAGLKIGFSRDQTLHDRFFILNNGVVFKLGRGVDLYKPVAGLGAKDTGLREVRSGEIDVFGPSVMPDL